MRDALDGHFDDHHAAIVAQLLAHIDALDAGIATLDDRVGDAIADYADLVDLVCTIPCVHIRTAEVLIAEAGAAMTVFPTSAHLASWAGICPGNRESAGKQASGHTRPWPRSLRAALTAAAIVASRTRDTYLAAHLRVIRGRRGKQNAIGAVRHDILIAYLHIASPTTTSVRIGTTAATAPRSRPNDSSANSNGSATPSRRNPPAADRLSWPT